jgi:hypothetical protein
MERQPRHASGSSEETINICHTHIDQVTGTIRCHKAAVMCVAVSEDRTKVAAEAVWRKHRCPSSMVRHLPR